MFNHKIKKINEKYAEQFKEQEVEDVNDIQEINEDKKEKVRSYSSWEEIMADIEKSRNERNWMEIIQDYFIGWYYCAERRFWDVKYFIQKHITQGYSDPEVFDFTHRSTLYLLPRLKAMRANLHSHPFREGIMETPEQWESVLDEIIWSMERFLKYENADDDLPKPFSEEYIKDAERIENGFKLMGEYWLDLWD